MVRFSTTTAFRSLNARSLAVVLFAAAAVACAGSDDTLAPRYSLEAGSEQVRVTAGTADSPRILAVDVVPTILTNDIADQLAGGGTLAAEEEEVEVVLTVPAGERLIDGGNRVAQSGDATLTTECGAPRCYVLVVLEAPVVSGALHTQRARPTWSWTVPEAAVGFTFRVDEGQFIDAGAEVTHYTPEAPLSEGPHTFEVAAIDAAGNLSELASFTTFVDLAGNPRVNVDTITQR